MLLSSPPPEAGCETTEKPNSPKVYPAYIKSSKKKTHGKEAKKCVPRKEEQTGE
jgi:hypothetical protein